MKLITKNKKAFFDYEILESIEAGIVLYGDEVKSLRSGSVNLTGSFATFHGNELFIINAHIASYVKAYQKDESESRRSRKLLLHKKQLVRLLGKVSQKGITLIPLSMYLNERNKIKVEIGLCKHKKLHDKKESLREKDLARQTRRELKLGNY